MSISLFVSAGEASGDRILARVVRALRDRHDLDAWGMGGRACEQVGVSMLARAENAGTMGLTEVLPRLGGLLHAFRCVTTQIVQRRPRAALLVGFTEYHVHLGSFLRRHGVRVLWCVAPQVWAWRKSRLRTLHRSLDTLAVILPFEEPMWRQAGYDVAYVGHPAVDVTSASSHNSGLRSGCRLAVLCGSRDAEVEGLAESLLEAARHWADLREDRSVEVFVAQSLSKDVHARLVDRCNRLGCGVQQADPIEGAAPMLGNYDLALCASGTASLEAVLGGCPPVIAYRFSKLTAFAARHVLRVSHVGLPNILLGQGVFPELLQDNVQVDKLVCELEAVWQARDRMLASCRRVRDLLAIDDGKTFGQRIGILIERLWDSGRGTCDARACSG